MTDLAPFEETKVISAANGLLRKVTHEIRYCMEASPSSLSTEFAVLTELKKVPRLGVVRPAMVLLMIRSKSC